MNANVILNFWFHELEPAQWWVKDEKLDRMIFEKFIDIHKQANKCELFSWRESAKGCLAEIIILDQFSRNMFRDTPKSFESDPLALSLAQEAISQQKHLALNAVERSFLFMPFMHSESIAIHDVAVNLYKDNGIESNYKFEIDHRNII